MIESCSKKRMVIAVAVLGGLSFLVILIESQHLHTPDEDVHERHPVLKAKLSVNDTCWKHETYTVLQDCDVCTEKELVRNDPLVCIASGKKELVECHNSKKRTYRSCQTVVWLEERRFWTFEGMMSVAGLFSWIAVYVRQKQLDHRMFQRIQKQIAAGV